MIQILKTLSGNMYSDLGVRRKSRKKRRPENNSRRQFIPQITTPNSGTDVDCNEIEDDVLGRISRKTESEYSFLEKNSSLLGTLLGDNFTSSDTTLELRGSSTKWPCTPFTHSGWSVVPNIAQKEVQIQFDFPAGKSVFEQYRKKSKLKLLCVFESRGTGVFLQPGNSSIDDVTEELVDGLQPRNVYISIHAGTVFKYRDKRGRGLLQIHKSTSPQEQGFKRDKGVGKVNEKLEEIDGKAKKFYMIIIDEIYRINEDSDIEQKGEKIHSEIDEMSTRKIQYQYKKLAFALSKNKQGFMDDLPMESINILKKSWSQLLEILLPSFSSSLIDLTRKSSYFNMGMFDNEDMVCMSLKILEKYAKMQVYDMKEAQLAFSHIGIQSMMENVVVEDESSEAIFCLTIDMTTETELNSEEEKFKLCQAIENGIKNVIESPAKLNWVKNLLNEADTFTKNTNTDFQDIDISVIDIFPGSHKIIVRFRNVNFPEDPQEINCTLNLFQAILENLPSVETSCVHKQQDRPEDGTIQIKIHIDKKYVPTWNIKKKLTKSIEGLIDDVRHSMEKDGLEEKLLVMGVAPTSIEALLENIFEPDEIEIDIEPPETCHVETMRIKNIPLWPRDKTRLLELSTRNQYDIAYSFTKTFGKEISWEDVAMEMDALKDNDIYLNLQKNISKLGTISPYQAVIKEYKEQQGTVGGLLNCLDTIRNTEDITTNFKSKIDDLISSIHVIKESHFWEWSQTYHNKKKISSSVDSYDGLKKALSSSSSQGTVIPQNFCEWSETMSSVVEEGDQLWMWRQGKFAKPSFAHVAIFIDNNSVVHVQQQGLKGIIKRDQVEEVIDGSKFFIFRPSCATLERICGTPKERALACLGLRFTYSVTSGNCEVFANIVCNGTWNVWDSVQGEGHSHVDRLVTVVNGVSHFKTYQTQQRSLVSKMAERMLLQGFVDSSIIQINAAFEIHENIYTEITHEMSKETKLKRYRLIMVWNILEGNTSEKHLLRPDWSNAEDGRTCQQINRETSSESSALEMFNNLPKEIRNITDCSLKTFVEALDPHMLSEQDNMENNLAEMNLSSM